MCFIVYSYSAKIADDRFAEEMDFMFLLLVLAVGITCGEKETDKHGAGHKPPSHMHHDHVDKDGEHNSHYDHEAVLGSKKLEEEFDDLSPEESKRRLALLVKKMDVNGDGFVTAEELTQWILTSFQKLDEEDSLEQLKEHDTDKDGKVTWKEYISKQYGYNPEDMEDFKHRDQEDLEDFNKMVEEDHSKFNAADEDKDGALNEKEYVAFEFPYDFKHMHEVEMDRSMKDYDKNADGFISLQEFLGQEGADDPEWEATEKERFTDYDKNNDGKLDREEMKPWILPDNMETATEESDHLIGRADDDKDGKLSEKEIVDHNEDFVGSQATNYGAFLPHEEL